MNELVGDKEMMIRRQSEEEVILMIRRGPWTVEEDITLINYISLHGEGRWNSLARFAGLNRTGKSCRLRWLNYLRPDVRRGNITLEEQLLILELHSRWGNRWSKIAQHLPGRTDNEIKNYWRTRVQKHAKQLNCDVNSKQFKDTMRYLWMPRLVERIQAQSAIKGQAQGGHGGVAVADSSFHHSPATSCDLVNNQSGTNFDMCSSPTALAQAYNVGVGAVHNSYSPGNSSVVASSESFGTPGSDLAECCNNDPAVNQGNAAGQDCYNGNEISYNYDDQSLISPTSYFGEELELGAQTSNWMDVEDVSGNLWNEIDILFLQQ